MTTTEIVKRLWDLDREQAKQWTHERFDEMRQHELQLQNLPGWKSQNRFFAVPGQPSIACFVSRLPRAEGTLLVHSFVPIEHPHDLDLSNGCSCCDCGSVLPAVSDVSCYSCSTQAVS